MDLNPVWLRSFVTVAEELHFGRAARRLRIAQPAVSRHVRSLEDALGAQLLVRTSRATTLTDAGAAALGSARLVLAELDRLRSVVREAADGRRGRVTVAFVASTVSVWLPALVAALGAHHGELLIDAVQVPVAKVGDELRRGTIDLAVTRWVDGDGLVAEPLGVEPTLAVLPPGHRLAGRADIALAELSEDPLVLTARRAWPAGYDAMLTGLRAQGLPCADVRDAAGPAAAMALVAAGVGVTLRPQSGVEPGTALPCVALRDQRSELLAVRRAGPPDPAFATIVDELRRLVDAAAVS
jgi:DNA-binding transcriptional LysR family regulator